MSVIQIPEQVPREAMFMGLLQEDAKGVFPHWMHKEGAPPLLVQNQEQADQAKADGYDVITKSAMSNPHLINWFWDMEDFSPKQLHVFCKEEFDVDLPIEAGQEALFKNACLLVRAAPQNRNRMVLMAHTMKMNYDATIEEIKRMHSEDALGVESIMEEFEFVA